MKRLMSIVITIGLAAGFLAGDAAAQGTLSDRTIVTFSGPVQVPGVVLPAGTYVFKIADPKTQNAVQVFDENEEKILGQWLIVDAERQEKDRTSDTVMEFVQADGSVPAIQYWWYPGELIGKEFVYPEEQARQIQEQTGQQVRFSASDDPKPVATGGTRDDDQSPEEPAREER